MTRLGIELLSVLGMPPVEHVALAADLGCGHISSGLVRLPWNPAGYPEWSLYGDLALRRELRAAMRDRGVVIGLGEGFAVRPGQDVRDKQRDLDIFAELGTVHVNGVSMEPDLARTNDQFALLAGYAHERGMTASIEFAPPHPVGTLAEALAVVAHVGRPGFGVLLDAMHFYRSGGATAELAAVDPALIRYGQLCDVPLEPPHDDYMREAMFERRVPGQGSLPLAEFVAALPRDVRIGLEVPMLAETEAGVSARDRLAPAVTAAEVLLARL
jgi:sugar phosphate isomerase/epimerase